MKRQVFANRSVTTSGKPIYELVFNNVAQDPVEVAKSKRYLLLRDALSPSTITVNEKMDDFIAAIEADWTYGKSRFLITYGPLVTLNMETNKKKIQFAGYWD